MTRQRIICVEEVPNAELIPVLRGAGLNAHEFLSTLSKRIRGLAAQSFADPSFRRDSVSVTGDVVTFSNVAGTAEVTSGIDLEIVPKFLTKTDGWHADWVSIVSATRQGRLVLSERVSATFERRTDLATITAVAMLEEHAHHLRKPIRRRRRETWREWDVDGDIELVENLIPDATGVLQTVTKRTLRNPYMSLLAGAYDRLLPHIRDAEVRRQTMVMRKRLGPQDWPQLQAERVPGRSQEWQPLLSMAARVLEGASVTPRAGSNTSPSFLIRTWQAWESLLFVALRQRPGILRASHHPLYDWGMRASGAVTVTPDILIETDTHRLLVDAKYKTRGDQLNVRASQSDLMEASAFAEASDISRVLLLYPRPASLPLVHPGSAILSDRVDLPIGKTVLCANIEVRGYGRGAGAADFSEGAIAFARWVATASESELKVGMPEAFA